MSKILNCEHIQVDVEKASHDLALMFAKIRLEEVIKTNKTLSTTLLDTEMLDQLMADYYTALGYIATHDNDDFIKELVNHA